jgi:hypothetical protein
MIYKHYGERNSGTNFLENLLKVNFGITWTYTEWKHSIPSMKDPDSVEFIIVRPLTTWLSSMYAHPYHLKRMDTFTDFLTLPQAAIDDRHDAVVDNNKTIFEIRYDKYKGMMHHFNTYGNVCLVQLDYIQNDANCAQFLHAIQQAYKFNKPVSYTTILPHTKTNANVKNHRPKLPSEYISIINQQLSPVLEHAIETLTFKIKA